MSLPCLANEAVSYSWSKDAQSVDVVNNPRMTLRNGSLHITDLERTDQGKYVCTAKFPSSLPSITSPASLELYGTHSFYTQIACCFYVDRIAAVLDVKVVVSRGTSSGNVSVTCHVSGSRPITVEFLRDGATQRNVTTRQHDPLTVEIPVVVGNIVQCVASNKEGSKQASHYIDAVPAGKQYKMAILV